MIVVLLIPRLAESPHLLIRLLKKSDNQCTMDDLKRNRSVKEKETLLLCGAVGNFLTSEV